jgi:hypothetical protein
MRLKHTLGGVIMGEIFSAEMLGAECRAQSLNLGLIAFIQHPCIVRIVQSH